MGRPTKGRKTDGTKNKINDETLPRKKKARDAGKDESLLGFLRGNERHPDSVVCSTCHDLQPGEGRGGGEREESK